MVRRTRIYRRHTSRRSVAKEKRYKRDTIWCCSQMLDIIVIANKTGDIDPQCFRIDILQTKMLCF